MGLKEIYYSIEDKYYAAIEWLSNNGLNLKPLITSIEGKGIPSLPLFTILLLVIVGGAYLYATPNALAGLGIGGGTASFTVNVKTAAGEPVEGALVTITGTTGTDVNVSQTTGPDGAAAFSGLPNGKRVRLTITKTGFTAVNKDFLIGATLAPFTLRTASTGQVTLLVTTADGEAVNRAQVSYAANGETKNTLTTSQGVATLNVPIGVSVTVTVSAQGYNSKTDSFTPDAPGFQHSIALIESQPRIPDFPASRRNQTEVSTPDNPDGGPINFLDTVTIGVSIQNSTGSPVEGAVVVVRNAADQSEIGLSQTNENGTVEFPDVPKGISIWVGADAEGYFSQQSPTRSTTQPLTFRMTLLTISNATGSNLTIELSDDANSRTITSKIFVVSQGDNKIVKQLDRQSGKRRIVQNLEVEKQVYLAIYSDEHVRYTSDALPQLVPGDNNTFTANLTKKDTVTPNSVNLQVTLADFYGQQVNGGSVSVSLENGHVLFPVEAAPGGVALLRNLPLPKTVIISASNGSFSVPFPYPTLELTPETTNITVILTPGSAGVTFVARNAIHENQIIDGANLTVYYVYRNQEQLVGQCDFASQEIVNGGCTLALISGVQYKLVTSAPGYFSKEEWLAPFSSGTPFTKNILLYPLDSGLMASGPKFFDVGSDDGAADDVEIPLDVSDDPTNLPVLQAGKVYYAVFDVNVPQNAVSAGAYLRVGDDSSPSTNDNGVIYKGFPLVPDDLINSGEFALRGATSYSQTNCGDTIDKDRVGIFKWLEASKNVSGSGTITVKIPFIVTKATPKRLNFSYRAYAVFDDGAYLRAPSDSVLGSTKDSGKKDCAAQVNVTTFKVNPLPDSVVQCGNQACMTLSFRQADRPNKAGGEGFEVKPVVLSDPFPNNFFLDYSIFDFNPNLDDGTELSFQPQREGIVVQTKNKQPPIDLSDVELTTSVSDNKYSVVSKTFKKVKSSIITTPTLLKNPEFPIELAYGDKVRIATWINLVGLPEMASELSALPAYYVLNYNATPTASNTSGSDHLDLLYVNGTKTTSVPSIDFLVDPIMPADAVMILFNFTQAPCEQLVFNFMVNDSGTQQCFEQVNDPRTALTLAQEYDKYGDKLMMLKYDSTKASCRYNSKNPNSVKVTNNATILRVVSACTGTAREFGVNIKADSHLLTTNALNYPKAPAFSYAQFKSEYNAVTVQNKVWSEPAVAGLNVDPSYLHVLLNNRQYSDGAYVRVYQDTTDPENPQDYMIKENQVILPVQGSRVIATLEQEVPKLLGVGSPNGLLRVYDPIANGTDVVNFYYPNGSIGTVYSENQPDSMQGSETEFLNVLRNTAFRRRQTCNPPLPCPFGMFPYSAFANLKEKPTQFHLGGDLWTGKYGVGEVDFANYGLAGEVCDKRSQEGVYDYYWEYSIDDKGTSTQLKKYKPLQVTPQDYETFGCSATQPLCGKLSFGNGQCINNCGDGWYYGAPVGYKAQLCEEGTQFKIQAVYNDTEQSDIFAAAAQNAVKGMAECIITETAFVYTTCQGVSAVGGGPLAGAIASKVAAIAGGQVAHYALAEALDGNLETDVPSLPKFFKGWQQACSYAGTAIDAYSIYKQFNELQGVTELQCPGIADVWKKCACLNPGPDVGTGFDAAGCWLATAAKSSLNAPSFQASRQLVQDDYEDFLEKQKQVATLKSIRADQTKEYSASVNALPEASKVIYGQYLETRDVLVAGTSSSGLSDFNAAEAAAKNDPAVKPLLDAEANIDKTTIDVSAGQIAERAALASVCTASSITPDSPSCTRFIKQKSGDLETLADVNDWFNGLCSYPFVILGAQRLIGGVIQDDIPERVHLQILNSEKKSDSFIENIGGWFTDEDSAAVDCTPSDLTPGDSKDYVWHDWDMSSLRGYRGDVRTCMDDKAVAMYVPQTDEEANYPTLRPDASTEFTVFYVTSKNH